MTDELKPCPFCGGKAEITKNEMRVWVHCTKCHSDTYLYQIQKEAVAAWNARPIEDKLRGKIGKLERENKRLREALDAIYKVVNDSKGNTRSFSIYDAARIYAECCYALKEGAE